MKKSKSGPPFGPLIAFFLIVALLWPGPVSADKQTSPPNPPLNRPGAIQFLTGPNAGDPLDIALRYLNQIKESLGLSGEDLADLIVSDRYVSRHNGVTHLYLRQRFAGIEVFNANININIARDGSIINLGSSFVPNLRAAVNTTTPSLSAIQAVESAARHLGLEIVEPLTVQQTLDGPAQQLLLNDGGISLEPIPVKLVYQPVSAGNVRLAWDVTIYELDATHYWSMRVDALTGRVLSQIDWVDNDDYRVYPLPVESPNHTVPPPPADGRVLVNNPAHPTASPYGWHDTNGAPGPEFTITRGNNVHAYEDGNNPGFSPDGGASLVFDFPIDLTQHPDTYEAAAITNLFYWNNIIHDVFYLYGFDEPAGNFQANNYGHGGLGNDWVKAEGQDGSGTCNANFGTPPDGGNGVMQMYLCNLASPTRDGDLDNGVIVHEYGHGISNRLVGGPSNVSCLWNNEQPGEGWSDWLALVMTIEPGDAGTDARGMGTYLFGQPSNGPGIRPAPYSTDMSVNNFTYADINGLAIPHGVGFVWATMLWEMTWNLIDEYGFNPDIYGDWTTGGNNLAIQLVIDGMKYTVCSPGFVDARNAILLADQALTGGANQCTIWKAFAKRGLGYSASQGSSQTVGDETEAFDLPSFCEFLGATPTFQDICIGDTAAYSVTVGGAFIPPVTMSAGGQPVGSNVTFDPNPVPAVPGETEMTVSNTGAAAAGAYTITITGTGGITSAFTTVTLNVFDTTPSTVTLTTPPDGATGVDILPTFAWTAATQGATYTIEVDDDPNFGSVDYIATVRETGHTATSPLNPDTTYHWRVRAENPCSSGNNSDVFSFTTRHVPSILLVDDDDNSPDVRDRYTTALDALGLEYDIWDTGNSDDEPNTARLAPYKYVIWFTGGEYGGFAGPGAEGEGALGAWLDAGNCLLLSSQDYLWDRGGGGADTPTQFMIDYLGMASGDSDSGDYSSVTGQGSVFGGLGPYNLSYPFSDYADIIIPNSTAEVAFRGNNNNSAAIAKDSGVYRTTFWGFPFEAISTPAGRKEALEMFLTWCGAFQPEIAFTKTAGTDPNECAATDSTVLPPGGGDVTYCYRVQNTGNIPLALHDLYDSKLGLILDGHPLSLMPGDTTWITRTATITQTTVNTATWTAYNTGPTDVISATDVATVTVLLIPPELHILKTVEGVGGGVTDLPLGSIITYTIVLTNSGEEIAAGAVLTDELPQGVHFGNWLDRGGAEPPVPTSTITWAGEVPGEATHTIRFTATITEALSFAGATITNTVWFSSANAGGGFELASFTIAPPAPPPTFIIYLPLIVKD